MQEKISRLGFRPEKSLATIWLVITISGFSGWVSSAAQAQDLDVPRARTAWERERAEADRARGDHDREVAVAGRLQTTLDQARNEENRALSALSELQAQLQRIDRDIATTEADIRSLGFQRDTLMRQRRDAERDLPSLISRRDRLGDEIRGLERGLRLIEEEISRLESAPRSGPWTCCAADSGWEEHAGGHCSSNESRDTAYDAAQALCLEFHGSCSVRNCEQPEDPQLEELRRERDRVRRELEETRQSWSEAEAAVGQRETDIQGIDSSIRRTENDIVSRESSLSDLRSRRSTQLGRIADAERTLRSRESSRREAETALSNHAPTLAASRRTWEQAEREAQAALDYLRQVEANYAAARNRVLAAAEDAARRHASSEAGERAPVPANMEGRASGEQEGASRGQSDVALRDFAAGWSDGRANAGLDASLRQSFDSGLAQGREMAVTLARSEDWPRGWNDALDTTLAEAPEFSATVDITSVLPPDPGQNGADLDPRKKPVLRGQDPVFETPVAPPYNVPVAGRPQFSTPAPDFRHRDRPCSGLVLPEFEPLCRERYDATYTANFRDSWAIVYLREWQAAFNSQARVAYDRVLGGSNESERERGRQQGAREKGVLDGFAARILTARVEQYDSGRQAMQEWLKTGNLLIVREVSLVETSSDGLFSGGEDVLVRIVVDNYGHTASPLAKMRVRFLSRSGVGSLSFETRELPALAARTRTTLVGVTSGKLLAAASGSSVTLSGTLESQTSGTWAELERISMEQKIRFPLELESMQQAAPAPLDQDSLVSLRFVNNAQIATGEARVVLSESNGFVLFPVAEGEEPGVVVPSLEPGGVTSVEVKMRAGLGVPDQTPLRFLVKASHDDELSSRLVSEQLIDQRIQVARNAILVLTDTAGRPIQSGRLSVAGGTSAAVPVLFKFLASQTRPGPFAFRWKSASHPTIRPTSGSTTGVRFNEWNPRWTRQPDLFRLDIPASLRGQAVWGEWELEEAGRVIHRLRVGFDVR
jgi:predicted  nucleic acid-binding Zn-ribbon protein